MIKREFHSAYNPIKFFRRKPTLRAPRIGHGSQANAPDHNPQRTTRTRVLYQQQPVQADKSTHALGRDDPPQLRSIR
ncbi:MAG: hypothetical protein JNM75_02645 [Rhodospirillales bacterium]|nr:hypothetical protein [Rhodospirillales bacterium]